MSLLDTMYTPHTVLDAVNSILDAIGEESVDTLDQESNADVANAVRLLQIVSAEIQARKWTFNVDEAFELVPNAVTQQIAYLPSYLEVSVAGGNPYVNRGGFLYDRINRTDRFTGRVTVSMTQQVPFEELPLCFRQFITYKTAFRFNAKYYGEPGVAEATMRAQQELEWDCQCYELDYGNYNLFNNDPDFQTKNARS